MVRKISTVIIVLAVVAVGLVSFRKVNMWDRSAMIFKYKSSQQFSGRGMGRGRMGFEGRGQFRSAEGNQQRPDRNINFEMRRPGPDFRPDSASSNFNRRGDRSFQGRQFPDSLRLQGRNNDFSMRGNIGREREERTFRGDFDREGGGRVRDGFRRGRRIYLKTVGWYLGVFALFTVVAIYLDKVWQLAKKHLSGNK